MTVTNEGLERFEAVFSCRDFGPAVHKKIKEVFTMAKRSLKLEEALKTIGDGPESKYKAGVDAIDFAVYCNETACKALKEDK